MKLRIFTATRKTLLFDIRYTEDQMAWYKLLKKRI